MGCSSLPSALNDIDFLIPPLLLDPTLSNAIRVCFRNALIANYKVAPTIRNLFFDMLHNRLPTAIPLPDWPNYGCFNFHAITSLSQSFSL